MKLNRLSLIDPNMSQNLEQLDTDRVFNVLKQDQSDWDLPKTYLVAVLVECAKWWGFEFLVGALCFGQDVCRGGGEGGVCVCGMCECVCV